MLIPKPLIKPKTDPFLRPEVAIDTGVLIGKYRSHEIYLLLVWISKKRWPWTIGAEFVLCVTSTFSRKTPGGSSFSSFTKIPFAEPPLGDLRFSLPVPAKPWDGVRDAGKPCPKPIQNNYVTGSSISIMGNFHHTKYFHYLWLQVSLRVRRIASTSMFIVLKRRRVKRSKTNHKNFCQWVWYLQKRNFSRASRR